MLTWLRSGGRSRGQGPGRADRRALSRLARLPRGQIRKQADRLRRLPPERRELLLARLPAWQQEPLRREVGPASFLTPAQPNMGAYGLKQRAQGRRPSRRASNAVPS